MATPAAPTMTSSDSRRSVVAGAIGNAVEFVDWNIYATFSPIFAAQFFPSDDPTASLLSTLAIFAIGFVMRPIGGAILGPYTDLHGRKRGLTLTVALMAIGSLMIALCPGYGTIGIAAPIILLLARLLQGFSNGGEFGASSAFLVEKAPHGKRAFYGSWQQVTVAGAHVVVAGLGTLLTFVLSDDAVHAWGWRIAFGIGALLGLLGLWIRTTVTESETFEKARDTSAPRPRPLVDLLRNHPGAALRVVGITVAGTVLYYVWVSYFAAYVHVATGMPLDQALLINTIGLVVFMVLLPFGGKLSDRWGRKTTMVIFAAGFLVIAWPSWLLLQNNFWVVLVIELVGLVFLVGYSANCAVVMAEQFPASVRGTGIALPYALAVALFGGTAPYVTTWLVAHDAIAWTPAYLVAAAVVGVIVYLTMPETKDRSLA